MTRYIPRNDLAAVLQHDVGIATTRTFVVKKLDLLLP
jgi:hypothetical protein